MSIESVIEAAVTLISNANIGFTTVADAQTHGSRITTAETPICLIWDRQPTAEVKFTIGPHGWRQQRWNLECHVWAHYPDAASSAATFRALIESLKSTLRANQNFSGNADTATTHVVWIRSAIKSTPGDWQQGQGVVIRHEPVSSEVLEIIQT